MFVSFEIRQSKNVSIQGLPGEAIEVKPGAKRVVPVEVFASKVSGISLKEFKAVIAANVALKKPNGEVTARFSERLPPYVKSKGVVKIGYFCIATHSLKVTLPSELASLRAKALFAFGFPAGFFLLLLELSLGHHDKFSFGESFVAIGVKLHEILFFLLKLLGCECDC